MSANGRDSTTVSAVPCSLIVMGGAKGKRMALPNARLLIHQPSGGFQGQSADVEIHARQMLETRRRLEAMYASHTGRTVEELRDDMDRDRFFSPEEAIERADRPRGADRRADPAAVGIPRRRVGPPRPT